MDPEEIADLKRIAELSEELDTLIRKRMTDYDIGSIAAEVDSVHELHKLFYLLADTAKVKIPGVYTPPGFK